MASQSLYRKWRSQTFSDLVGQEPVIRTLKNALNSGKLGHAYLFTGPRGTGKTSTARLLAKTINCLQSKDGEPCNKCEQCREITAGNSFNVIEIDAASNRGIDSIRDLREKVMMPPSTGKYKVYILDEAHMLTPEAFNALLKTLEEPPAHAVFVMATTDVHKMLPTVLSRCQRFDFKRITTQQIVERLHFVAQQEHVTLERGAAELIARAAAGGMRDALSLLDQAIAYSGQEIALAQVQTMLGVADPRAIQNFITHVAQLDSAAGLHLIHELADGGSDLRQINTQIAECWRAMMLSKAGASIATILDSTEDEIREITQLAQFFSLEELTECARIFAQNDLMQKNLGTPQLGLELALLASIELHRRIQTNQSTTVTMAQGLQDMPLTDYDGEDAPEPVRPASPVTEVSVKRDRAESTALAPSGQRASNTPSLTVQQVKEKWEHVKKRMKTKKDGVKVAPLLNDFVVVAIEGTAEQGVVVIQAAHEWHHNALSEKERYTLVEWALKMEFEQEYRVRLLPPGQPLLSLTPPSHVSSRSANTTIAVAPQQSAHRERPTPEPPLQKQGEHETASLRGQEPQAFIASPSDVESVPPLARMPVVRENTSKVSSNLEGNTKMPEAHETRQEIIKQKATGDPVVQEVIRMFKANIKDIQPK